MFPLILKCLLEIEKSSKGMMKKSHQYFFNLFPEKPQEECRSIFHMSEVTKMQSNPIIYHTINMAPMFTGLHVRVIMCPGGHRGVARWSTLVENMKRIVIAPIGPQN